MVSTQHHNTLSLNRPENTLSDILSDYAGSFLKGFQYFIYIAENRTSVMQKVLFCLAFCIHILNKIEQKNMLCLKSGLFYKVIFLNKSIVLIVNDKVCYSVV